MNETIEILHELANYHGWKNWDEIEKEKIRLQKADALLAEYESDSRGMGI